MVRIQGYSYPAVLMIVFDGIFNEVGKERGDLNLINLGNDLTLCLEGDFNVLFSRDGAEPFKDELCPWVRC